MKLYPIIMAGGEGTRLWPISRKHTPKQAYPFVGKESLLQKTFKRLRKGFPASDIFLATRTDLVPIIQKQLPGLPARNISIEPIQRDTAPALGLALMKLWKRDPKGMFVYINADNFIRHETEFIRVLKTGQGLVQKNPGKTILIGVNPTYPETGYGYIKLGDSVNTNGRDKIFKVDRFVEKPDLETAKKYLASWDYLWNPTLIMASVEHFFNLYKKYLPKTYKILKQLEPFLETSKERGMVSREFKKMVSVSIDYGILEKEKGMLVIPGDFGWMDIGHWKTIEELLRGKGEETIVKGQYISVGSRKNLIYSTTGRLVASVGIHNMVIVDTEDALLVCPIERAQEVKQLVQKLEKKNLKHYL